MLNRGMVEPTAANADTRETTAETNASRSVTPRLRASSARSSGGVPSSWAGRAGEAHEEAATPESTPLILFVALLVCGEYRSEATGRSRLVGASRTAASRGRLGARRDRAGCDTDPGALTLLVRVRVQSFLLRSVGEHRVCGAAVDQRNVTEDADVDIVHSEILEGARVSDVVEELGAVAGDTGKLRDEVFGEELAEALGIAELVGVEEILVELLEGRQIFGGLHGVGHGVGPVLCGFGVRCRWLVASAPCTRRRVAR